MIYLKLFSRRVIDDENVISAINRMDSDEEIIKYLDNMGYNIEDIMKTFEKHYGIEYVNLNNVKIEERVFDDFDIENLRRNLIVPYDYANGRYYFATNNIIRKDNVDVVNESTDLRNLRLEFKFAFKHEIERVYDGLVGKRTEEEIIEEKEEFIIESVEIDEEFIVKDWVNNVLNKGINYAASDIHVESRPGGVQIRYRIDGVLTRKEFYHLADSEISNVMVRLKLISGMDISEKRKPQDGRISRYILNNSDYDFRVSCVNTNMGEKIVLRIFNRSEGIASFEDLGFMDDDIKKIKNALNKKNGVIYIAGATGSGKTTTLYSMIEELNSEAVNIYTIEDPIEKEVENVNQIQIDRLAGITFPSTLKSLLRQDPDIIVVGEVRDVETADLSISASLTGHLVISTMHANNAIDSISRLFEMGIEPFLLGTSSLLFMSQKLVRRLCPKCKKKVDKIEGLDRIWLKQKYKMADRDVDELARRYDIYESVGCDDCSEGYKGRVAVGEFFEVTRKMREYISRKESIRNIEELAYKEGYRTIDRAAIAKVFAGVTSISELIRQIG